MSSSTSICNSALIKIGAERITALTDNNKRAILCNEQYDKIRRRVISAHPWNFATRRVQLAKLASTPVFEYDNEYQIPSDCLRIFRVRDQDIIDYRIEGRKVLSDSDEIYIEYASDITDVSQMPWYFQEYLSYEIAYDLCYAIVQSSSFRQTIREDMIDARRNARNYDSQEGTPRSLEIDTWTNSRIDSEVDLLRDGRF